MEKVSIGASNNFCPQPVFLFGTAKEDGSPNFGMFTWAGYCWDAEFCFMAAVEAGTMTSDRIRASKMFSANLVTEPLLPLADYFGNVSGHTPGKMDVPAEVERGRVLDVPVLKDSPWVFELEVKQTVPLDGNDIFICKIRNVLAAKELTDESINVDERVKIAAPVIWFGANPYYAVNPAKLGEAGEWKDLFKKAVS